MASFGRQGESFQGYRVVLLPAIVDSIIFDSAILVTPLAF
jgi:hypothetical protein